MPPTEPAIVLLNPRAANGRAGALVEPITQWLASQAPQVRCAAPDGIAEARALIGALPAGVRLVLVGGDGTLQAMLSAILERGCVLGLVPFGSGDDGARALGLRGLAWREALAHALSAPASAVDLGECRFGERRVPFASSLTAGFDSAVGLRALRAPRLLRGLPRYLWATLAELASLRRWALRIEADGAPVHDGDALFASVLNTPTYGGGMPVVPAARIDDAQLDLIVAGRFNRAQAFSMLPRLMAAQHLSHPQVHCWRFTRVSMHSPAEVPLAADGEFIGAARAWEIRVLPQALRVARRA